MAETHRLLIVDDETELTQALGDYLRGPGIEILTASELEEAQALIERKDIDLVIADLKLTGQFGLEGFQLLTFARERSPLTHVLLLTAYGSPEVEAEALRRGAKFCFNKPLPMETLAGAIRSLGIPVAG